MPTKRSAKLQEKKNKEIEEENRLLLASDLAKRYLTKDDLTSSSKTKSKLKEKTALCSTFDIDTLKFLLDEQKILAEQVSSDEEEESDIDPNKLALLTTSGTTRYQMSSSSSSSSETSEVPKPLEPHEQTVPGESIEETWERFDIYKRLEKIRGAVHIEGDQVQIRDLDKRDAALRTFMADQFAQVRAAHQAEIASNAAVLNAANQQQAGVIENGWWQKWGEFGFGDGKYTPPNWRFPKGISAKTMWMMWLFGNQGASIRPYRLLRRQIDVVKADHVQHSRAQGVMKFLIDRINEHCAEQDNLFHPEDLTMRVDKMTVVQSDLAFDTMFKILHADGFFGAKGGNEVGNRAMYMTYGTMYNLLKDYETINGDRQKRVRKK